MDALCRSIDKRF